MSYIKTVSATVASSTTSAIFKIPAGPYLGVIAAVNVTAASGTSPTLNLILQNGLRLAGGTYLWNDYASFIQSTTTTSKWLRWVVQGEESHASSDGALAAGEIRNGPIGTTWRLKYVVAGTTPSFTAEFVAEFLP